MDVIWLVPNQVILYTMPEVLTLEGIQEVDNTFNQWLDSAGGKVHLIADNSKARRIPLEMGKVIQAHTYTKHPNLGWVINVKTATLIKFAGSIMNQTFHTRFRFVDSLEEAVQFLRDNVEGLDAIELVASTSKEGLHP